MQKSISQTTLLFLIATASSLGIVHAKHVSGINGRTYDILTVDNSTGEPLVHIVDISDYSYNDVIQINMRACNGKVLMSAASTLENLHQELFDLPVNFEGFHTDQLLFVQRKELDTVYISLQLVEGYSKYNYAESLVQLKYSTSKLEDLQNVSFPRYVPSRNGRVDTFKDRSNHYSLEISDTRRAGVFRPAGNLDSSFGSNYIAQASSRFSIKATSHPVYAEILMKCQYMLPYAQYDLRAIDQKEHSVLQYPNCITYESGSESVCTGRLYANEPSEYFYIAVGAEVSYEFMDSVNVMYGVVQVRSGAMRFLGYSSGSHLTYSLSVLIFMLVSLVFA